ncbi:MAG: PQQ-dependent sugar dehydrogenase [Planctomycetales bacterium]|nr:PQQ-dependent sugar dehydrogenase [Planctomycetales bacterium]
MSPRFKLLANCLVVSCYLIQSICLAQSASEVGKSARTRWTTSRVEGAPEAPLPYILRRFVPLEFEGPISINRIPETNSYLVSEYQGKVYSFSTDLPDEKDLAVDFNVTAPPTSGISRENGRRIELFSMAFHPQFKTNRQLFICYITLGGDRPTETNVSRFELSTDTPPRIIADTETEILKCEGGGHNGCTLAFGPDNYLYISLGDLESPNPPDPRNTGQDISDLYSSILRIDVDKGEDAKQYAIPPDNPFVAIPSARPEVYAYGLRNPFRMSFDPQSGDLWVGDVGWEAWEMVYRVRPGGNYGWAIKEGPGDVKVQLQGPTPILPADVALGHAEAASVTGGVVYHGQLLPELRGKYVFGDWITRKYWSVEFDNERVIKTEEIAFGTAKPICFETQPNGEILILDYSDARQRAGVFELAANPERGRYVPGKFPERLSQSGLFENVAKYELAPGVQEYSINAPMWQDGATATFAAAAPDGAQFDFYQTPQKTFDWFRTTVVMPRGSVLIKTLTLPRSMRRIETQMCVKDEQGDLQYYTYRWNEANTDADLVPAAGETANIEISSASGASETLEWTFHSRAACRICHTPWRGEALGFVESQLRSPHLSIDSWRMMLAAESINLQSDIAPLESDQYLGLVSPSDTSQPLDRRARSYLHANCAHCHIYGGNASTSFDLMFHLPLADLRLTDTPPIRGDLGLPSARLIAPHEPARSILFYRIATAGGGRMPHLGSQRNDPLGIELIHRWISQLPPDDVIRKDLDVLCAPRIQRESSKPRYDAADRLLQSISGASYLAAALAEGRVPDDLRRDIVMRAGERSDAIRDLLDPFADPDQRIKRLGDHFEPQEILALSGDAQRGQKQFEAGLGGCIACHRVAQIGKEIGPRLDAIPVERRERARILQSIMRPSMEIEEKYRALMVLTSEGQAFVGQMLQQTDDRLELVDSNGNTFVIPQADIEQKRVSEISIMPERLLNNLTGQQVADLLEYILASQAEPQ